MTERIRRTWRRTAAWMKCLVVFGVVIGLGAGLALAMDTDNDGMSDEFESFFGLNTASNEAALNYDGDTLDNLAESLLWTDPFVADTDSDGIQDGADSNPVSRAYIPWGDPAFTRTNDTVYTWPDWMVAAFKNGGTWQTSIPCWWVSASETGFPTLNMEVDRGLLTNDLLLLLPLTAGSNATLFMDLYDANESVIASNLGNNLLVDVGTGSVKTLSVSLSTYTNAVGIKLRRETGEVSVGETLLYVDMDGDALRDLDELRNTPDSLDATFAMSEESALSSDSALLPDGDSSVMLGLGDEGMMASYSFSSPDWTRRMVIAFNGYAASEALTNFPVLVVLSNNVANSGFSYADFASTNGFDLRFTDQTLTNELSYEIEIWNTNGASCVWVRVPVLTNNANIWAYWGDSSLVVPAVYTTNGATWDSSFKAVWHMVQTNTTDSTSHHLNAASFGNTTTPGRIGGAQKFNGSAYQLVSGVYNSTRHTISAFIVPENASSGSILSCGTNNNTVFTRELQVASSNFLHRVYDGSARLVTGTTTINTGTYYHVAGVAQDSSIMRLFVNGAEEGTPISVGTMATTGDRYLVGRRFGVNGTNYFTGIIDELRIETVVRSSNWIRACWLNMASNQMFNSIGEVQNANTPPTVQSEVTPATNLVAGTNVSVSVLGADDGGETNLTYAWTSSGPASVTFSSNNSNSAKDTTACFVKAGTYWLEATIADLQCASVASSGSVTVAQTLNGITVSPGDSTIWNGTEKTFAVSGVDQFGDAMTPTSAVTWSVSGGGTIGTDGVFTAMSVGGPYTVLASNATFAATATVSVVAVTEMKMQINFNGYTRSEPLTNFPVLVVLSNNVASSGFSYAQFVSANGFDLRFTSKDMTNELPFEVEKWNTNGASYIWVRVPILTNNSCIWAHWGDLNLAATPAAYTTNGATWGSSFRGVWHMAQTNTLDSTSNHINAVSFGNTNTAGIIGGAQGFSGNAYQVVSDTSNLTAYTISAFVMPVSVSSGSIVDRGNNDSSTYSRELRVSSSKMTHHTYDGSARAITGNTTVNTGRFYYVAGVAQNSSTMRLFVNGFEDGSPISVGTMSAVGDRYLVGRRYGTTGTNYFKGIIDELRIETVVRSSNWVWAAWLNMASNTSFLTCETVESMTPNIAVAGSTNVSALTATLLGNVASTGDASFSVYALWGTNSASWDFSTNAGLQGVGPVSIPISGLWPERTYYFTFMMSNESDMVWSDTQGQFTTTATANTNDIPTEWQLTYFGQTGIDPNIDSDSDGLTNLWEYLLGTNPTNVDTDEDMLIDGKEVSKYDTSPVKYDTADDGIPDSFKKLMGVKDWPTKYVMNLPYYPYVTLSPVTSTSSYEFYVTTDYGQKWKVAGTGIPGNLSGTLFWAFNIGPGRNLPSAWFCGGLADDSDGDGLGDGFETFIFWNLTYPDLPDSDFDDISDGDEDFDGDGLSNKQEYNSPLNPGYDPYRGSSDPLCPDTDGDGVCDGPTVPAPWNLTPGPDAFPLDPSAWLDTDHDGKPDELHGASNSGPALEEDTDDDNDGLSDAQELAIGLDPKEYNQQDTANINSLKIFMPGEE